MEKKRCFVIMPFSTISKKYTEDYWTKHYENFLKPLIEENKELEAHRSSALREDIVKSIINSLVTDPIVVADLTRYNPNVLWELGVRQSFKSGTITIAEEGTRLPFNISSKGTLFYSRSHTENKEFKTNFHKALKDCLNNPDKSDSIVFDTIMGRGTIFEIIQRNKTLKQTDSLILELELLLREIEQFNSFLKSGDMVTMQAFLSTIRFSSTCLEYLFTTRYLNLEQEYYLKIHNLLKTIKIANRLHELTGKIKPNLLKEVDLFRIDEKVVRMILTEVQDFRNQLKKLI